MDWADTVEDVPVEDVPVADAPRADSAIHLIAAAMEEAAAPQ